jgi:molecular chaperone DnaK
VSRSKFEQLTADLVARTIGPSKTCLKDAGIEKNEIDEVILVGGMTRMPKVRETVKEFFGKEPFKGVNPDEAVAVGAAIQGGVLSGKTTGVLLLDVTPLSLGIETLGGVMTKLISSNTTIPTKKTQTFSTAADNQTEVEIKVLQGDRAMAADNKVLGRFNLVGIPPAPKGVPQIEVGFDIDANGIVNVSAKDKATNKEQRIQIKSDGGLSKEEIARMREDAEANADADKERAESTEAKNTAESNIWQIEKNLDTYKDQLTDNEREEIRTKIAEVRSAIDSNNNEAIKSSNSALQEYTSKIFADAYQKKAAAGESADNAEQQQQQPEQDSTQEAEFKDVNDK